MILSTIETDTVKAFLCFTSLDSSGIQLSSSFSTTPKIFPACPIIYPEDFWDTRFCTKDPPKANAPRRWNSCAERFKGLRRNRWERKGERAGGIESNEGEKEKAGWWRRWCNTARSSGQSATKALRRSHLSLLRLFSRPLFRGVSLSTTRVDANTLPRACISDTHDSPSSLLPRHNRVLPPPLFSLSSSRRYAVSSFGGTRGLPRHQLQRATTCRCIHGRACASARARASDRACGYTRFVAGAVGVRVGRRGVGDGTRDTSRSGEREGQREWGGGLPSFFWAPRGAPSPPYAAVSHAPSFSTRFSPSASHPCTCFSVSFDYARYSGFSYASCTLVYSRYARIRFSIHRKVLFDSYET